MYKNRSISLLLPTYNEKDSIGKVINDFENLQIVDEILVINNNAIEGTSEVVAKTTAKEIYEPVQGYGAAIRRGLKEATCDLIVICEPDDTFLAKDIFKLLAYVDDADIVYSSRTVNNFICEGANMGKFTKWGCWGLAKMIEVLFNTNSLSDVGSTYRLITRNALEKIESSFRVNTNFFGSEMMILSYPARISSVQIPVNYKKRVGKSSATGNFWCTLNLGIKIIVLIIALRLGLGSLLIPLIDR
jgi:glycosyltransferase involved in cell wall biosynthesis